MAISGTKYMRETTGSVDNAGTSATALNLIDAVLDAAGTNLHYLNHGYTFTAGDALNLYTQETDGTATEGIYEITAATTDDITIGSSAGSAVTLVSVNIGGPWLPKHPAYATGPTGNISESFGLNENWTLLFVRCHFTGGSGSALFAIGLDAAQGSAYDTLLYTVDDTAVGTDTRDLSFRLGTREAGDPSAWEFRAGDLATFAWTNPNTQTWGLTVGMIPTRLLEAY